EGIERLSQFEAAIPVLTSKDIIPAPIGRVAEAIKGFAYPHLIVQFAGQMLTALKILVGDIKLTHTHHRIRHAPENACKTRCFALFREILFCEIDGAAE